MRSVPVTKNVNFLNGKVRKRVNNALVEYNLI